MNLVNRTNTENKLKDKRGYLLLKRGLDAFLSALLILILSPLLLLIALLIKSTSSGPVFYSQGRVGLNGTLFTCYKFRSMRINDSISHKNVDGTLFKKKDDDRVTRVGKIIRRSSLDELPQLYNVLAGEMSLVGPRPLIPFMLEKYPEFASIRSLVRPGMTGVWQINNRHNNTNAKYMIEYDLKYLDNFSFLEDLKILVQTIPAVLKTNGAI